MALSPPRQTVVEHCWVLIGIRAGALWRARRTQFVPGERTTVAFNATWVLRREERRGDVVGFYHTHPSGTGEPKCSRSPDHGRLG